MSTEQTQAPREGWFIRLAGAIGDLGHPFYDEERQRDVWNEASAVGFQLMLFLGLAAASAMVWVGGATAVPYAVTVMGVVGLPSVVTIAYTQRLGVRLDQPMRLLRLRLVPYLALVVLFVVGLRRAAPDDGTAAGLATGMAVGAGAALLWLVGSELVARRRLTR